jgi:hypothetical protein
VIATKRILAKVSTDPGFAFLLDSEDLEEMITDHGRLSNEGLSSSDFSRTMIAWKTLLPLLPLNGSDWFEDMETLRLAEGPQVER